MVCQALLASLDVESFLIPTTAGITIGRRSAEKPSPFSLLKGANAMPNRFVKKMGKNESVLRGLKGFSNVKKKEGKGKMWHLRSMYSCGCGLMGLFRFHKSPLSWGYDGNRCPVEDKP